MKNRYLIFLMIFLSVLLSCNEQNDTIQPPSEYRTFRLGFTPFPYAISNQAVEYVYSKIDSNADIIVHHFDDGIPWNEALTNSDYHPNIISDWQFRKFRSNPNHQMLVSVTPINFFRNGLALYKSDQGNQPLPSPWDTIKFNDNLVKQAFLNHCIKIYEYFKPDYLCVGIEVNLLMSNSPHLWEQYKELQQFIYDSFKVLYPNSRIILSVTGFDLIDGLTNSDHLNQIRAINDIQLYCDMVGFSLYPYLTNLLTDPLPGDLLDRIFKMTTKPVCVTETGYPAQEFSISNPPVTFLGSEQKQYDYLKMLFSSAQTNNAKFIINFVLRDYDSLWIELGSPEDVTKLWRDTGLWDENGNERLSLSLWKEKLKLPVQ